MSIKGSLKTLVCLPDDQGEQFVERLSEIVAVMSKLRVRAFHAVTLFLIAHAARPRTVPGRFLRFPGSRERSGGKFRGQVLA
jgi:hypothetical protein